ncbi:MAG: 23S rRNA (guanosine(2251)-2'-O)-methyltransferase RlmB [Bacilli bacterium]|nr:23S rRNA (guanosine(2251)-2'-O)-methyltransferase RlmB [Bacilli bacterium]
MYVYGKNSVNEVLKNNRKIKKAYIYKNFSDKNIISAIQKLNIQIKYLEKYELDKLAKVNHQGIILSVPDYKYYDIDDIENPFVVILDHIEDPHNFGAIIRTCEAAGVDSIIIPRNRAVEVNDTVMRVSVGALDRVKIIQVTNLVDTIKYLKKIGYWIVGTDMEGTDYKDIDYNDKIGIVIGNEGNGMSRLVKDNCDFVASIPMKGKINSLNASVAAGIIIFEALKIRK